MKCLKLFKISSRIILLTAALFLATPLNFAAPATATTSSSSSTGKYDHTAVPIQLLKPAKFDNSLQNVKYSLNAKGKLEIEFTFAHKLAKKPSSFITKKPTQLVIDFEKISNNLAQKDETVNLGPVQKYSSAQGTSQTRFVMNLTKAVKYQSQLNNRKLLITLESESVQDQILSRKLPSTIAHYKPENKIYSMKNIDFRRTDDGGAQIVLHLSSNRAAVDIERHANDLLVDVLKSKLPRRLQRKLDVTDFDTPVGTINLQQKGGDISIKIHARREFNHLAYQVNKDFIVDVKPLKEDQNSGLRRKRKYTGQRISLNFQNIPVRSVLQLLAEFTGLNVVTSDAVNGSVTLRLHHVPWDQALDIILKSHGLAQRQVGNVLLIAPAQQIAQQEQEELQAENQIQALSPLHSEFLQVNYADAAQLATLIRSTGQNAQSILSQRGFMSVDTRTNVIWVHDTSKNLKDIRELIQRLDVPVRQVLIEARVVNVDTTFEKDLGVRFGVSKQGIPMTGTLSGANTIASGNTIQDVSFANRLNVDLPASTSSTGATSHIGVALASLGRGYLLDLELSAMEEEGKGNIVSTPRIITANKSKAVIEDGEEIPYQQVTSSGATSVAFKKAVLGIEVTPQITPDNKVVLSIKVNQDKVNNRVVLGVPALDTQMVETQVLVDNGGTVVLGGIYRQTTRDTLKRVPFFSSIPLVGHLFREKYTRNDEKELLIFLTPKVITQAAFHHG